MNEWNKHSAFGLIQTSQPHIDTPDLNPSGCPEFVDPFSQRYPSQACLLWDSVLMMDLGDIADEKVLNNLGVACWFGFYKFHGIVVFFLSVALTDYKGI